MPRISIYKLRMGNCCKKSTTEEAKLTVEIEEHKSVLHSAEELEEKYEEMIKKVNVIPPAIKVGFPVLLVGKNGANRAFQLRSKC